MAPTSFPVNANISASLVTTSTLEKVIAGICIEGILPDPSNVATPFTAAFSAASIFPLKFVQFAADKYPSTDALAGVIEMVFALRTNGLVYVNGASKSAILLFAAVPKLRCANTSVPMTSPKLALASIAFAAPVPPFATATVPVTFVALPEIFPITFEPATVLIFASVTLKSAILIVVTALFAIVGLLALPVKSPAKTILPFNTVVASGAPETTEASTYSFTAFCVG